MAKRKKSTAVRKAESQVDYYKKLTKKYDNWGVAQGKAIRAYQEEQITKDKKKKAKLKARVNKYNKLASAQQKAHRRYSKLLKQAQTDRSNLRKQKADLSAIADKIAQHNAKMSIDASSKNNEGHAAIYPSDGSEDPIYISPSDSESEDMTANITNWPVDEGAPRADYARVASKTVTVGGIITGRDRSEANAKYDKLKSWMNHHKQLTYKGDIYYKHLMISDLQQSFTDLRDNLKVSITFTFVYWAQVTTSTGNNSKKKSSKSSKRTEGHRSKKYVAVTVKHGDTLYGFSKKYHKSVKWLQKVNHIKDPSKLKVGTKVDVGYKRVNGRVIKHVYKESTQNTRYKIRVR